MGKQARMLLDRAAKYIAKGLEKGAYTDSIGSDLFANRLLEQLRDQSGGAVQVQKLPIKTPQTKLKREVAEILAKPKKSILRTSVSFLEEMLISLESKPIAHKDVEVPQSLIDAVLSED